MARRSAWQWGSGAAGVYIPDPTSTHTAGGAWETGRRQAGPEQTALMNFILLLLGFTLLLFGAEAVIRGATAIARRTGAPEIVIGLVLVSIGTSLPELLVNVVASAGGNSGLAIGNVLGSNVANILLILGVAATVRSLPIRDSTIFSEIPFSLTATLLVGFLANAHLFNQIEVLSISRLDGAILLAFFLLFLCYIHRVWGDQHATIGVPGLGALGHGDSLLGSSLRVVLGCIGLGIGAHWVVRSALEFGELLGMSESFMGLTVVAVGTSLPELVTCAVAARRGNTDIAVGTAIGSNIFNLLWVLGISAMLRPLPFDVVSNTDILIVIASSALLLLAIAVGVRYSVDRKEGIFFLVAYVAYLAFLVQRG
jgi:cation:H+ antiporter